MKKNNQKFFDIICGMDLALSEIKYTYNFRGEKYYFCSKNCHKHFKNNPGKYAPIKTDNLNLSLTN